MKSIALTAVVCFAIWHPPKTGADEPILRLETGGHSANCNWIGFTPDGRELVSLGSDKVIRVWDVSDPAHPALNRTHRVQIGEGLAGILTSASIAPQGDVLAVGGLFQDNAFLLLELRSGDVLARITGHDQPARAVAFSADGRYLVACSDSSSIAVCDMTAWRRSGGTNLPAAILTGHQGGIIHAAFVGRGDQLRLVSTSLDRTCRVWRPVGGQWVLDWTLSHDDTLFAFVAPSPDGRSFALSCLNHQARVFTTDGLYRGSFGETHDMKSMLLPVTAFTPNDESLVYGFPASFNLGGSVVYDLSSGRRLARFDGHNNTVLSIAVSPLSVGDDPLVASTGGDANEIFLWNGRTGEAIGSIIGRGRGVYAIAVDPDGTELAFGQTNAHREEVNADHPLDHVFDLESLDVTGRVAESWTMWSRRLATSDGWSAVASETQPGILDIYRHGEPTCRIEKPDGGRVVCYSFLPDGRSVVVGYDLGLVMYDTQTGRPMRNFVGHEATVWAVSVMSDGKTMFSASGDQTFRAWDLHGSPDRNGEVQPLLNFFVTADASEWIAWTNEGYYMGSPGADAFIGWHINRAGDESADFAAAWQYARVFRRPDIVSRVLEARSTGEALRLAALEQNQDVREPLDVAQDQEELAVPRVRLNSPAEGTRTQKAQIRVAGVAQPNGSLPITEVRVLVNGRPASLSRGFVVQPRAGESASTAAQPKPFDVEVGLLDGENHIEVIAATDYAVSQPVQVTLHRDAAVVIRPTLYVLGIGVARYADEDLVLSYPDDDVEELIAVLEQQAGGLYKDVVSTALIDEEVTGRNVRRALVELRRRVTQHDVAIVVISGHGDLADGQYFYCPHDHDPNETAVYGIRFTELTEPLSTMPCKVLLCLDTCHAAGVLGPTGRRSKATVSAVNRAVAEMTSVESGIVVMASSTGHQTSVEDDAWGHGAFALALIEALSGTRREDLPSQLTLPCDLNGDDILELVEIDAYVTARVKELTGGRQQPVTERGRIPSFPLATVP